MTPEQDAVDYWGQRIFYTGHGVGPRSQLESTEFGVYGLPYAWGCPWHEPRVSVPVWQLPVAQLARVLGVVR